MTEITLRFSVKVDTTERIRNMFIRTAQVESSGDKVRKFVMVWTCTMEAQWTCWTKDGGYGSACEEKTRKITEEVHGCGKEKMERVDVTEDNVRDRWKWMIRGGDP